ncbi:MAG TPA: metallophosphoesterase [Terriglobia bacterium]|nr:metallophosphoesterase [Terriglobia bacterium]
MANGFIFGDPSPTPDNYDTFNPQDVFADSGVTTTPVPEPIPAPWKSPPVMSLDEVLDASDVEAIQNSGSIVFHAAGDTGGVKEPSRQFAVADALSADLAAKTWQTGLPAFFFNLGDVVYYFGQEKYYYDQFYDPYRNYNAPIFAIPGNHDGVLYSGEAVPYSLQPFYSNFCAQTPTHPTVAGGVSRTTMTQPGVYFTLDAPFVKIIGLYSNTSEGATQGVISGGAAGTAQLTFLEQQLANAVTERSHGDVRALIIAIHHPPFTGSSQHVPSPAMLQDIDNACTQAGILPDVVLSGHAHLYERYTRVVQNRQIPFVVAGTGGYFNHSKFSTGFGGAKPAPPVTGTDAKGNPLTLEAYNDTQWGFLRLTASAASLTCQFFALPAGGGAAAVQDSVTLDLSKHVLTSGGAAIPVPSKPARPQGKPPRPQGKPPKPQGKPAKPQHKPPKAAKPKPAPAKSANPKPAPAKRRPAPRGKRR